MAARISGMLSRALVMAMVGRMSDAAGDLVGEDLADEMAPGVERDDPLGLGPLRMRADRRRSDGCWCRSGRASGLSARAEIASAR